MTISMLEVHATALSDRQSVYHEFLSRYKHNSMCVYGFVEGKDDPSFYRGAIENNLPEGWSVDLWSVGNKEKVIELHNCFDWTRFSKNRVVFFIDKDLSYFLGEKLPTDSNVYITDKYSIENDIVSRNTCDRVLTEVCSLNMIDKYDKDKILGLFDKQLAIFQKKMTPLMAWIIHWKRSGSRPSLNDILMKHLFIVKVGELCSITSPKSFSSPEEYIHKQCNIIYKPISKIAAVIREFKTANGPQKFIRGKYELWFFIEFVLSIYKNITRFSNRYTKSPKMNVTLSQTNAITLIAARARIPSTLKNFLDKTHVKYVKELKGSA